MKYLPFSITLALLFLHGASIAYAKIIFTSDVLFNIQQTFGGKQIEPSKEAKKKHIFLVVADDLGYADHQIYRPSDIPTPNLVNIAKSGVVLDNYYTQTVCSPTRAALMTGRFPFRTGMQHRTTLIAGTVAHLPLNTKSLAEYMDIAGYERHMIGKWHLGYASWAYTPTGRGFQSHFGYLQGQVDYYTKIFTFGQPGTDGLDFWYNKQPLFNMVGNYSVNQYQYAFENVLKKYTQSFPKAERPLFVYYALQSVHIPLESGNIESARCPESKIKDYVRRIYCAMTVELDDIMGDIVNKIKKYNLWDDSLFIFTTDNGGMVRFQKDEKNFPIFPASIGSNYPLRGTKALLFEGGVRSTAFITGGKNVVPSSARGSRFKGLMHSVDLAAIALGAAGLEEYIANDKLDGINMLDDIFPTSPKLRGDSQTVVNKRKSVPINIVSHATQYTAIKFVSKDGFSYKLIVAGNVANQTGDGYYPIDGSDPEPSPDARDIKETPFYLFNLDLDPNEHHNLVSKRNKLLLHSSIVLEGIQELISYMKAGYREPQRSNQLILPNAFPPFHNGTWQPFLKDHLTEWEDEENTEQEDAIAALEAMAKKEIQDHLEKEDV